MLRVIYHLLKARYFGHRYYFILLEPDCHHLYDGAKGISAPFIADGVNTSITRMIEDGHIRAAWSVEELEEIERVKQQHREDFTDGEG